MTDSASRALIEVQVNGAFRLLPVGSTVATLLEELGKDPRTVAVEHEGRIVRRHQQAEIELVAGDRLEVVQFVQGGGDTRRRFRL